MSVYQNLGKPVLAGNLRMLVEEMESRIARDPKNAILYLQAGELLDRAGFFQKAHSYLAKAEELDPSGAVLVEFRRRRYHSHQHGSDCSACDALCGLCVLDSCCECMGGDIIECC
ncbi:MAG TPA: hypothetical protein VNU93_05275 [Verrucomicrobiae bacterium]|nr:hypothetical protein [Verrucomicrobiae bacterium]